VIAGLNLSGRVAALLAGAVVLIVLIAGWALLISPERSKAADLSTQTADTRAKVDATQAYVDSPTTKAAVHDLKRLKLILPDDPRMSQILRQLSAASATAGVRLDSIVPTVAIPSNGGEALPIGLSVTGHYFNISRFLQLLEAKANVKGTTVWGNGRLYSVDTIQFAGGGTAAVGASTDGAARGGTAPIAATLALNAFIYSPVAATPPATTASTAPSSDTSTSTPTTSGP
jgi:hypothetical protein